MTNQSTDERLDDSSNVSSGAYLATPIRNGYSNVQPLWHVILLNLMTFGFYILYWSYKNWKQIKEYSHLDVSPLKKTLLLLVPLVGIVVLWEQFVEFKKFCERSGSQVSYTPAHINVGYILCNALWYLPEPYTYLGLTSIIPLVIVQRSLNSAWTLVESGLPTRHLPTVGDILAVIVGWVIIISLTVIFSMIF